MTILSDLLDKLNTARGKVDAVQDRVTGITQSKSGVAAARAELEQLKDNAPGMKDSRAAVERAFAARAGKVVVITPTMDISKESIVDSI